MYWPSRRSMISPARTSSLTWCETVPFETPDSRHSCWQEYSDSLAIDSRSAMRRGSASALATAWNWSAVSVGFLLRAAMVLYLSNSETLLSTSRVTAGSQVGHSRVTRRRSPAMAAAANTSAQPTEGSLPGAM